MSNKPTVILDDRWGLGADNYQYILYKKFAKPQKDGRIWEPKTYHPTIYFALKSWAETVGLDVTQDLGGGLTLAEIKVILKETDNQVRRLAERIAEKWPEGQPSAYSAPWRDSAG